MNTIVIVVTKINFLSINDFRNYDAEEEFKRMKNLGLFQSG